MPESKSILYHNIKTFREKRDFETHYTTYTQVCNKECHKK